jgi:hypothetical protein
MESQETNELHIEKPISYTKLEPLRETYISIILLNEQNRIPFSHAIKYMTIMERKRRQLFHES